MISEALYRRIQYWLIAGFVFLLPNSPEQIKIGSLILLIAFVVMLMRFGTNMKNLRLLSGASIVLMAWFFLKILGLSPEFNNVLTWKAVFLKLPFFILPLVFVTWQPSKEELSKLLKVFVMACAVASGTALIYAVYRVTDTGDLSFLTYSNLSPFLHPAYIGMYVNFAFLLAVHQLKQKGYKSYTLYSVLILFTVFIFLLLSRNAIILLAINIGYLGYLLMRARKWSLLVSLFGLLLISTSLLLQNERARLRIKSAFEYFEISENQYESNSFGIRVLVWKSSIELIKENIYFGVGTGSERKELNKSFDERDIEKAKDRYYNTHNQFLQTALAHGILGIIILLLIAVVPYMQLHGEQRQLFVFFILFCTVSFFTESMLERQAGVFFFAMFYTILSYSSSAKSKQVIKEFS